VRAHVRTRESEREREPDTDKQLYLVQHLVHGSSGAGSASTVRLCVDNLFVRLCVDNLFA